MNATNFKAARIAASLMLGLCTYGLLSSAQAGENRLTPIRVEPLTASLSVDCAAPRQLRQQDVSRVFDIANQSQTYDFRARLRHIAKRACLAGVDRVLLIKDESRESREAWDYVAVRD